MDSEVENSRDDIFGIPSNATRTGKFVIFSEIGDMNETIERFTDMQFLIILWE
ncbi:hypothetical protein [Carnobacterium gallinarum]|uniref:hypothetical protein n=1 Tax=Carnobacterium gallinarum TaxID=2749 RepID=UPI00146FEC2A|nr:hypothetical protein [Carnobacterium gallinarum]